LTSLDTEPLTAWVRSDDRAQWLWSMVLIRQFEEAAEKVSLRGKIPGGLHPAIGQEAVAVGTAAALGPNDIVTSGHRPHHHALARGVEPRRLMAELFGRATGLRGGRSGSMHLSDFGKAYFGANGIVGASAGIAMGAALAAKLRGLEQVAVGCVGDGAANTGRTWEFVNMAVIWQLPLIVICENNLYAVETHTDRVTGGKDIARRAEGFGLPSFAVDGQDVDAVHEHVKQARDRALAGEGPTFLEAKTYRYHGHETGDKAAYRTAEEIAEWRTSRDPIDRLAARLEADQQLTAAGLADLNQRAVDTVADALQFAEASEWPRAEDAFGELAVDAAKGTQK
jgi:TPP-dependent pyruvate/acetoin dehydrogenase alpha subunit